MHKIWIGALTGTSMDAASVGAFSFTETEVTCVDAYHLPIPADLKIDIQHQKQSLNMVSCSKLSMNVAKLFADAVKTITVKNSISKSDIGGIGFHGQTIYHAPPISIQLGDSMLLSSLTGLPVISNFRYQDLILGGTGAPLSPLFHQQYFNDDNNDVVVVNIGGISNISYIPRKSSANTSYGYDIGPGNCLVDYVSKKYFNQDYDVDGLIASSGSVNKTLLEELLKEDFFQKRYPKSLDTAYFLGDWLENKLSSYINIKPIDIVATLSYFTVQVIFNELKHNNMLHAHILLVGGGANNLFFIRNLKEFQLNVCTKNKQNLSPCDVESGLFAWLAKEYFETRKFNLENFTGNKVETKLGMLYHI